MKAFIIMLQLPSLLTHHVRLFWSYLREAAGEDDYARYLARVRRLGGDPITEKQFYLAELERKYSRINRCC
jgi:uncharacterized short protein YbdD (DUF466 family)